MLQKAQKAITEFMLAVGQDCPTKPIIPAQSVCLLRSELIREEFLELDHALMTGDLTEVADGIGDLLVVVLGTAVACGIDISPIFEEIHRSNMTKLVDGHPRDDGKWIKGPSYEPAVLAPILEKQPEIVLNEGE